MSQFETLCKALEGLQSQAEVPGAGALAPGGWESHKPQTFCLWLSATHWKIHKCFYGWTIWFWGVIESQSLFLLLCGGKSFSPHSVQDLWWGSEGRNIIRRVLGPSWADLQCYNTVIDLPSFPGAVLEAGGFPPLSHPSWSCSFVLATASISWAQLLLLRQVSIPCLHPLQLQTLHKALDHS